MWLTSPASDRVSIMPTNVSPDYKRAESEYKQAREPEERLECLREMLRTIPKQKSTEHLQTDKKSPNKQIHKMYTVNKQNQENKYFLW